MNKPLRVKQLSKEERLAETIDEIDSELYSILGDDPSESLLQSSQVKHLQHQREFYERKLAHRLSSINSRKRLAS